MKIRTDAGDTLRTLVCAFALGAFSGSVQAGDIQVYLTTADQSQTVSRQPDLIFDPGAGSGHGTNDIDVDAGTRYQTLTAGFGVAITDTAAWLIHEQLPPSQRDEVMGKLFSPATGIGLSFLRVPIGGSDYVVGGAYTYDDQPAGQHDPWLWHFSIEHDRAYILPTLRQALHLNPAIKVMANPWSPPAWMKTDDSLVPTRPFATLRDVDYGVLSEYFVRFIRSYKEAGVHIDYLGVQNEPLNPLFAPGIPGMYLSARDEGRFIRNYLTPALEREGFSGRILAWDFLFLLSRGYLHEVMDQAGPEIGGMAYHCYESDPSAMSTEHALYPGMPQLETECASYLSNIEPEQMAIRSLRNWAEGIQLWGAAVDQNYGPKIGNGCVGMKGSPHAGQDCIAPVIVDSAAHTYRLTSDYWALGQFSKFIRQGAQRIDSSLPDTCIVWPGSPRPCGLEDVAFQNPDGSRVLVATSHNGKAAVFTVTDDGRHFSYTLPDGAIATFVWKPFSDAK